MDKYIRYYAFLRAINVGGHVVKMDVLREILEKTGLTSVQTFIQTGNVLFDGALNGRDVLEKQIEQGLHAGLGYPVATFLRIGQEIAEIAALTPFDVEEVAEKNEVHIAFLKEKPLHECIEKLLALSGPTDDYRIIGREVYWLRRRALGDSKMAGYIFEKVLGMPVTVRNRTTIRKMMEKFA